MSMSIKVPRRWRTRPNQAQATTMLRGVAGSSFCALLAVSTAAHGQQQFQAPASPDGTDTPAAAPSGLVPPSVVEALNFDYPELLKARKVPPFGLIRLKYVVRVDGSVGGVEVVEGVDPRLDYLAGKAVKQMRYEPARYEGEAVEVVLGMEIEVADPRLEQDSLDKAEQPANAGEVDSVPEPRLEPGSVAEVPSESSAGQGELRISGVLLEAGQRTPVAGATVIAIPAGDLPVGRIKKKIYEAEVEQPWTMAAETGPEGQFELRGVPNGKVRLILQSLGFERLEYVVELGAGERLELKYYQTRLNEDPYRTTVAVERDDEAEVTRHSLTQEEITKIPGTQGDALKSIQNLPGVARAPFGIGLLVIRGARPSDSRTFFAQHEIPNLFHFGGLSSVVNSDVLTQIDFLPGNFDVRFGDAIGGIVDVAPRKGRRDGFHGYIDSDIIDTGVLFEGPIGKGSFILSGRRSYIDAVLNVAVPSDAPINFVLAPRYYDYQAFFDHPIGKWDLTVRGFGSDDQSKVLFAGENDDETDARNSVEQQISFHRADIQLTRKTDNWEFFATPSYRFDLVQLAAVNQFKADVKTHSLSGRMEFARRLGRRSKLRIGNKTDGGWFTLDIQAPAIGQAGSVENNQRRTRSESEFLFTAFYTSLSLGLGDRLTIFPGVRATFYSVPSPLFSTDARIRMALRVGDATTLKAGFGQFTQIPTGQQTDPVFGNPNLGLESSLHSSVGVQHDFPSRFRVEVTGFHKHIFDQVTNSSVLVPDGEGGIRPQIYSNEGLGRAYGMELLLRKSLTRNFFGWISYTLMRSEQKGPDDDDFRIVGQDQTHILTLIGSYKLPKHWQVGLRFRLTSGVPRTPVANGIFDAAGGSFLPINGPLNSERLPMFHQLDLRVDKEWILKRMSITAYLDIQNVYNAQNVEALTFEFDFSGTRPITGLPIIPSVGTKLEF